MDSLIAELNQLTTGDARLPWLRFVADVADCRVTDVQVVSVRLREFSRTPDDLASALSQYCMFCERVAMARQLPDLEHRATDLGAAAHELTLAESDLRDQIRAREADVEREQARLSPSMSKAQRDDLRATLAGIRQEIANLRDQITAAQAAQRTARGQLVAVVRQRDAARQAVVLLRDEKWRSLLPDDLRDLVGA